jgi:hypothetical protein
LFFACVKADAATLFCAFDAVPLRKILEALEATRLDVVSHFLLAILEHPPSCGKLFSAQRQRSPTATEMNTPKSPKANSGSCSVNRLVRHVFSVNVPDENLMDYIEERAAMHPKGLSGYVRDLVLVNRAKWQDMVNDS